MLNAWPVLSKEDAANHSIPIRIFEPFPPYPDLLLARAGELVTDDMLEEISEADYRMDAAAYFESLLTVRDEVIISSPVPWAPRIVLELVRWSSPGNLTRYPDITGERCHIKRAFCCAALLRAEFGDKSVSNLIGRNETLIQLIDSVLFLAGGLPEAACSFLTWCLPLVSTDDNGRPLFAFGLVALVALSEGDALSPADLDAFASFVEEAETAVRDPLGVCTPEMFASSFLDDAGDRKDTAWRSLARRLGSRFPQARRWADLMRRIEGA